LRERIADRAFREGRIIQMQEIADATGINRMTLSKMANHRDCVCRTDVLDLLCKYFECPLSELVEYVPDEDVLGPQKGPVPLKGQAVKKRRKSG
jgi:putative transcriptional regulator